MNEKRRLFQWVVLALLGSGVGMSIFGAFLGAERAHAFFNSLPLVVFWLVFALALAAGFAVFPGLRRCPGQAGMHLGLLLILAGSMAGSELARRLADRFGGSAGLASGVLRLREGETSATLRDPVTGREAGALPFAVRLDAFEMDFYPLSSVPPPLFYGVLAAEPGAPGLAWQTVPLDWEQGVSAPLADTPIQFRVTGFTPSADGAALSLTVELSAGGESRVQTLVCPPDEPFVSMVLHPLFPQLADVNRSASLILARPAPEVRAYRSRVTVMKDGKERPANILVNHPLCLAGVRLYQQSWGAEPERYTVLLAVDDRGWLLVWAGFVLLGAGTVWRFWIKPLRAARTEVAA